jgi:asparagine synthase (glutamine-hydrolysing)
MCGICGVVAAERGALAETVDHQLELLHHRGPDARGRFDAERGCIAQNRLAIIDLVTGDPPITN